MTIRIPFNKPATVGNEMQYVQEALLNGHVSGDGAFTQKTHKLLEDTLGVSKVLLTTSCTHALEMSAILLGIEDGDEVIVPSFTFVSTINAFVMRGAKPVFVDVRPDTLNMDENKLESLITQRTKAIVPVHYAGVACEMDTIMDIANRHNVVVVEDNAQGLFAKYKGRYLGTFGQMATISFHETKNFHCGEGGALFLNDPQYIERAEIIREKGTNRSRYFRGQVDKYTWVDLGSSYLPSDMLAGFLYAQFEQREKIIAKRAEIWTRYDENLNDWAEEHHVQTPTVPDGIEQSHHMYYMLLPSLEVRTRLIEYLKSKGIWSVFHYQPLHLSDMGKHYGGQEKDCPVTEDVSDRLLRLPFYFDLSETQQIEIIQALHDFTDWLPNKG
jgi:dTDP-4-amino-4,6-dideoxygalactose transaminase